MLVEKAAAPVQRDIILLWFILSLGLFRVPRHPFVSVLVSPASSWGTGLILGLQPRRWGWEGGPASRAWRWPRTPTQQDAALFSPEFCKGHCSSFLGVPSLDRRGLFQDRAGEVVERKHGSSV